MRMIRRCKLASNGWNNGDIDTAFSLFSCGMVWDGNICSKASRNHFVANGYAVRHQGMTALTGRGIVAFLLSWAVWVAAFSAWRRRSRNPFFADAASIRRAMAVIAIIFTCALFASPAFAADIEIGKAIGDTFAQLILLLVSGVVSTIIGWLAVVAKNKFGVDIEARHREALQAFINRQAASLVADGKVWLSGIKVQVSSDAVANAANKALLAIPDARKTFGLDDQRIADMILDALPRVPSVAAAQSIALDVVNPTTPSQPAPPTPQPVG